MSDLVPADDIERIVGAARHPSEHRGRAVSAEQRVYILHSEHCRDTTPDLRDCPYSLALDAGVNPRMDGWPEDTPVALALDERAWRLVVDRELET